MSDSSLQSAGWSSAAVQTTVQTAVQTTLQTTVDYCHDKIQCTHSWRFESSFNPFNPFMIIGAVSCFFFILWGHLTCRECRWMRVLWGWSKKKKAFWFRSLHKTGLVWNLTDGSCVPLQISAVNKVLLKKKKVECCTAKTMKKKKNKIKFFQKNVHLSHHFKWK